MWTQSKKLVGTQNLFLLKKTIYIFLGEFDAGTVVCGMDHDRDYEITPIGERMEDILDTYLQHGKVIEKQITVLHVALLQPSSS